MIRHVVLVRLRADVGAAETDAIFTELAALRSVLPGFRRFAAGPNLSPEGLDRGYTHAFTCDFDDAPARDVYLEHPAHKAVGARLVAAADGGIHGLVVIDFDAG